MPEGKDALKEVLCGYEITRRAAPYHEKEEILYLWRIQIPRGVACVAVDFACGGTLEREYPTSSREQP